jgi:hypothetical protein
VKVSAGNLQIMPQSVGEVTQKTRNESAANHTDLEEISFTRVP